MLSRVNYVQSSSNYPDTVFRCIGIHFWHALFNWGDGIIFKSIFRYDILLVSNFGIFDIQVYSIFRYFRYTILKKKTVHRYFRHIYFSKLTTSKIKDTLPNILPSQRSTYNNLLSMSFIMKIKRLQRSRKNSFDAYHRI